MKKTILNSISLVCASLMFSGVFAKADTPSDKHLVRELTKNMRVLNHSIYVYNWFNATGRNPVWSSPLNTTDYSGFAHVQSMGSTFWQSLCSNNPALDPRDCTSEDVTKMPGRSGMQGAGLYAAVDAAATSGYGGFDGKWVLLEIHLPKGFRIMSFLNSTTFPAPPLSAEALAEWKDTDCPANWASNGSSQLLSSLVSAHGSNRGKSAPLTSDPASNSNGYSSYNISQKCILSVRHLLKDRLHLEAFYYGYGGSSYSVCKAPLPAGTNTYFGGGIRQGAFVITDVSRLNPADVKVYNSGTADAKDDRIRIQTFTTGRIGSYSSNAPLSSYGSNSPGSWKDLDGQPPMPNAEDWIKHNLLGCQDIAPYGPIPNIRYGHQYPVSKEK